MEARVIANITLKETKVPARVMISHGLRLDVNRGGWYSTSKKALKWASAVGVSVVPSPKGK